MESLLVRSLTQLSWQTPVLVLYSVGMVASILYWRRYPGPCLLTILATGLLLASSVGLTFFDQYIVQTRIDKGLGDEKMNWLLATLAIGGPLIRAAAFGLLLIAVFYARAGSQKVGVPTEILTRPLPGPRIYFASAAIVLYLFSLALPAVNIDPVLSGFDALTFPTFSRMYPAWWANFYFLAGIVSLLAGYIVAGGICGVISLLLGLSFLLNAFKDFRDNEDPIRVCYWFWVGSMAVLAASVFLSLVGRSNKPTC